MWFGVVEDAFYPRSTALQFKGRRSGQALVPTYKALVPGMIFLKTRMDPDVADDLERVPSVRGLLKNDDSLVVPLGMAEVEEVERWRVSDGPMLNEDVRKIRVGEYVSVVEGPYKGKYGIVEGTAHGRIEVSSPHWVS